MVEKYHGQATIESRPIALLSRALECDKALLRNRLISRGVKTRGKTIEELITGLTDLERERHKDALDKLLLPKVAPKLGKKQKATVNVSRALVALYRASDAYGPVPLEKFSKDDVANGIADAIYYLGGSR